MQTLLVALPALAAAAGLSAAPSECAPAVSCQPPALGEYAAMAAGYGYSLDGEWVSEYAPLMLQRFSRPCARHARCLAVWGNSTEFCRDILKGEVLAECATVFEGADAGTNLSSCRAFATVFSGGQARASKVIWSEAQRCARARAEASGAAPRPPRVILEPNAPKPGDSFLLVVRACDESGDPVLGNVFVNGVQRGLTFQPIRAGLEFQRAYDADGRVTLSNPVVTVTSAATRESAHPGWGTVTTAFESIPSTVRLEVSPALAAWKKGVNRVTVRGFDVATGGEVRGKIRTTGGVVGASGAPIEVRVERGKDGRLCGAPLWFAADGAWYAESQLAVPACD